LIGQVRVVFNGAGASGIACAEHYVRLGVKRENITMCDTKGVIYKRRSEVMNPYKDRFAKETTLRTLVGHAGCGCVRGLLGEGCGECCDDSFDGAASIVFAMANPDPEITNEEAKLSREDVIFATGRSDYPNQVTTGSAFPSSFVGRWTCAQRPSMKK